MFTIDDYFSGQGGFSLGFHMAGGQTRLACEINPFSRKIYRLRFPGVPIHDDISTLAETLRQAGNQSGRPINAICAGFPCQGLSQAGKRLGLADPRSGLFYRLAETIDHIRPDWVLLENVPGLLSNNGGADMAAVLGTLEELGYGWSYRVLNAQHFGVPQRRRRVYIVGYLGDRRPSQQVLFEPFSLSRYPAPGGEASAPLTTRSGLAVDSHCSTTLIRHPVLANTLTARCSKGVDSSLSPTIVFSCKDDGRDVSEGIAPTLRAMGAADSHRNGGGQLAIAGSLLASDGGPCDNDAFNGHIVPHVAYCHRADGAGSQPEHGADYVAEAIDAARMRKAYGVPGRLERPHTPDGPRYCAMGNSVAIPVIYWLAWRMMAVDRLIRLRGREDLSHFDPARLSG